MIKTFGMIPSPIVASFPYSCTLSLTLLRCCVRQHPCVCFVLTTPDLAADRPSPFPLLSPSSSHVKVQMKHIYPLSLEFFMKPTLAQKTKTGLGLFGLLTWPLGGAEVAPSPPLSTLSPLCPSKAATVPACSV